MRLSAAPDPLLIRRPLEPWAVCRRPTWSVKHLAQQRRVKVLGMHPRKHHEVVAVDWRNGNIVRVGSLQRNAAAGCHLIEKCMARSTRRKRRVIIVTDRAGFHRRETSKRVAELWDRYGRRLQLRCVPSYSPECNPTEFLWNDWRHYVTHDHDRSDIADLDHDSDGYFRRCARNKGSTLRTIGSPMHWRQNRRNYLV